MSENNGKTLEERVTQLENRLTADEWVIARLVERIAASLPDRGQQLDVGIEDQARLVSQHLGKGDDIMEAAAAFLGRVSTELRGG